MKLFALGHLWTRKSSLGWFAASACAVVLLASTGFAVAADGCLSDEERQKRFCGDPPSYPCTLTFPTPADLRALCIFSCGDGFIDAGEECDDGNTVSGDGCSATCTDEPRCGNGIVEQGEACDDGNTLSGDGCSATCTVEPPAPVCGNGVLEQGEACDDGNTVNGDGCSATCTIEPPLGGEGCTPGYWKQPHHFDSWTSFTPGTSFESVFGRNVPGTPTLHNALSTGGGGLTALMRHTVAALLNAASADVQFQLTPAQVIAEFQAAFDSGNFETQKDRFEDLNQEGCPLN